jgi:hypothetical protein
VKEVLFRNLIRGQTHLLTLPMRRSVTLDWG